MTEGCICVCICVLSDLLMSEDDDNFLKRVLSGPVVREGSDRNICICIFVCICVLSDLLMIKDDDNFLKRVLSGPVVTEGSDFSSVYEAAAPDLGINPRAHSVFVFYCVFVFVFHRTV